MAELKLEWAPDWYGDPCASVGAFILRIEDARHASGERAWRVCCADTDELLLEHGEDAEKRRGTAATLIAAQLAAESACFAWLSEGVAALGGRVVHSTSDGTPRPGAPLDIAALPDWWDEQRRADGKPDASTCGAELRLALKAARALGERTLDAGEVALVTQALDEYGHEEAWSYTTRDQMQALAKKLGDEHG